MQPAFFLFIFGNSLGLVSFLLEILYFKIYIQQHSIHIDINETIL
jgi:hypothetical protein